MITKSDLLAMIDDLQCQLWWLEDRVEKLENKKTKKVKKNERISR